jgi:hypothetical protein
VDQPIEDGLWDGESVGKFQRTHNHEAGLDAGGSEGRRIRRWSGVENRRETNSGKAENKEGRPRAADWKTARQSPIPLAFSRSEYPPTRSHEGFSYIRPLWIPRISGINLQ